jgi:murein DD-endopeptidase MepM/ murein hydrolase activator NlpD
MSAQLNLNTHQAYGFAYDQLVVGWLVPQNTGQTPAPNPNCIQNAVRGSTGLARPFGNINTNPNSPGFGNLGHDGVHAVAPAGSRVTTLPALTGRVIDIHNGGDGSKIVDVLLDNGMVGLYKDLTTVNVRPNQRLNAGSLIGRTGGVGDARNFSGLHFSLLLGGMKGHNYYRDITSGRTNNQITASMFMNPLGANSPVNCPGVPVVNGGVTPAP